MAQTKQEVIIMPKTTKTIDLNTLKPKDTLYIKPYNPEDGEFEYTTFIKGETGTDIYYDVYGNLHIDTGMVDDDGDETEIVIESGCLIDWELL